MSAPVSQGEEVEAAPSSDEDEVEETVVEADFNCSILTRLCWYKEKDLWWPCKLSGKTVKEIREKKLSELWPAIVITAEHRKKCHRLPPEYLLESRSPEPENLLEAWPAKVNANFQKQVPGDPTR